MNIDTISNLTTESRNDVTVYDFTKKTLSTFNGWFLLILSIIIIIVIFKVFESVFFK
ncbi:hypothetical protein Catovirus_1_931 [Catovirus CTV1]|uniref:Uncharacterized protein n=1 Tax=Catovirus CTV1 TaxID=1977631 RepID=A0A1V0SB12_9VIRU|nr:hypothetical protein Catovirus_1_931 [Catovirus CTV1]